MPEDTVQMPPKVVESLGQSFCVFDGLCTLYGDNNSTKLLWKCNICINIGIIQIPNCNVAT